MSVAFERLKALYRLSRGTQATLSIAQPVLGVLLATTQPPAGRFAVALVAIVAGFFAAFALNDLLDAPLDRRRRDEAGPGQGWDLERAGLHPLAGGRLTFRAGVCWAAGLGAVAAVGLAALSWTALALFVAGVLLETAYCALARVSPYKVFLSGVLVACGAAAGWFAFTDTVDVRLALFALWMAAWEMGGRNVPNDMADVDEDTRLGITTLPTVHGQRRSAAFACGCLLVAAASCVALTLAARPSFGTAGVAAGVLSGVLLLVAPAVRLLREPSGTTALGLFNLASFQPPCVLLGCLVGLWW
ncbi:UbiA prenyltransferase family protein [Streptomyces sp. NPDC048172]|uniref:UbiA prenyltransferase family protein n=1 Tax=Streptomyces sp. NPDC048172 TaxID=3365505 RepID=UPI003723D2EE